MPAEDPIIIIIILKGSTSAPQVQAAIEGAVAAKTQKQKKDTEA